MEFKEGNLDRFCSLWFPLLSFANKRCSIVDLRGRENHNHDVLTIDEAISVRNELLNNSELFDEFAKINQNIFSTKDIAIVKQWRNYTRGEFVVLKHLKKRSIFVPTHQTETPVSFAVSSLASNLSDFIPETPALVDAVLLPFEGEVVYDGLMLQYPCDFSRSRKKEIAEMYRKSKESGKFIVSSKDLTSYCLNSYLSVSGSLNIKPLNHNADIILKFAEPIFKQSGKLSEELLSNFMAIIITVWNSEVGKIAGLYPPNEVENRITELIAPTLEISAPINTLRKRKHVFWPEENWYVGEWILQESQSGSFTLWIDQHYINQVKPQVMRLQ
jgi:hypothetical protein